MIRQFIQNLTGGGRRRKKNNRQADGAASRTSQARMPRYGSRVEIPVQEHGIDLQLLDAAAIEVVTTLQQAGFEAYVVGGAVRDLLLGLRPKDFDVATNATPEEVKKLFRRAFIIGKRFRIVHVMFGGSRGRRKKTDRRGAGGSNQKSTAKDSRAGARKSSPAVVIEVSTFRAFLDASKAEQIRGNERTSRRELAGVSHAVDAHGRVLRDNVWGSQSEDATRRDLSVNAMYYDPSSQLVVDYHRGYADMQNKRLRMIGDATERYREDPVRIMRAIRFAAKLRHAGFALQEATAQPIQHCLPLLEKVPQSRLFDESLKLFMTGHALDSVHVIREMEVGHGLYAIARLVARRADQPLVQMALADTDARVAQNRSVMPYFLLASLLWEDVQTCWERLKKQGEHPTPALVSAINQVFEERIGDVSGRGRLAADMREVWLMQPRFERRRGKGPLKMIENPRFRAALDFLRLREKDGQTEAGLHDWWQAFYTADGDGRVAMIDARQSQAQKNSKTSTAAGTRAAGKRRRRRRKSSQSGSAGTAAAVEGKGQHEAS